MPVLSVLLIDADAPSLKLERIVLEEADWRVIAVPSAAAALDVLTRTRPHLIVTDLPVQEPFEYITDLRVAALDTPIVVVTAIGGPATEFRTLSAGCVGFIRKPIDVTTFASQLAAFLGDHR